MKENSKHSTEAFKRARAYWKNRLSKEISGSYFPYDFPKTLDNSRESYKINFTKDLSNKIISLSKNKDMLIYVMLLVVLKILVFKYTNENEIVISSPTCYNKKDNNNLKGLIPFIDFLKKDMSFKELLNEVKETVIKGYGNQSYFLNDSIGNLDLSDSENTLSKIVLLLDNLHQEEILDENINLLETDIIISVSRKNNLLTANIKYNKELYREENIKRIAKRYLFIFKQVINDLELKLNNIKLIEAEEKRRILNEFNDTEVEFPNENTIHELFEKQVEKTPDNIAVVSKDNKLTYNELNKKANQLARVLKDKGVRPNDIVAIMVEPSLEMVIGIMAILKAGGAYLPIDVGYPESRLKYILEDSDVELMLRGNYIMDKVEFDGVVLNIREENFSQRKTSNLKSVSKSDSLVYTIYTSGTTGKPKGVLIKNESLVNYAKWFINKIQLTKNDKGILTSSFAFDLGYSSIYPTILSGGELHLVSKDIYMSGKKLLNYIQNNKISYLKATPSLFKIMVNSLNFSQETCQSLRFIALGGEAINLKDVEKAYSICNDLEIMNHYGPTETTIGSIAQFINFDQFEEYKKTPTIGRPINNMEVYILDKNLNLLPIGVPGEIYISGKGVAKGYLNREELNNKKFLKNPFSDKFEVLYKTGDKGRYLKDGRIEFLGRADKQIKIRGFRVEPKEVENRLLNSEGVNKAVVLAKEDSTGSIALYAYIVSNENLDIAKLKNELGKQLPKYMLPSYYVQLDKMPLTQNGKVDRKALPDAKNSQLELREDYVAPKTKTQKKIASIWSKVLNIDKVGINNNFFEIGGTSISILEVSRELEKNFNEDIAVADLFNHSTISSLAEYLDQKNSKDTLDRKSKNNKKKMKRKNKLRQRKRKIKTREEN